MKMFIRTETAVLADSHLFIKPGTDALFLLAVLYTILHEGLANPGPLAEIAAANIVRCKALQKCLAPERE